MTVFVSLLRAVNVGGRNTIRMADLKAVHEAIGLTAVRTLLQSGNVIFAGEAVGRAALARKIAAGISARCGLEVAVMVRTADDLSALAAGNPFPKEARAEPGRLLVMFLADVPGKGAEERLRKAHGGPERFHVRGSEVFLHYPDGVGKSKLTNALIEKQLGVAGTARNWNTVTRLRDIAASLDEA